MASMTFACEDLQRPWTLFLLSDPASETKTKQKDTYTFQ